MATTKSAPAPKMPTTSQVTSAVNAVSAAATKVDTLQAKIDTAASQGKSTASLEKQLTAATTALTTATTKLDTIVTTAQTVATSAASQATLVASGQLTGKAATTAVNNAKTANTVLTVLESTVNKLIDSPKISDTGIEKLADVSIKLEPLVPTVRSSYFNAAIETATSRDQVKNLLVTQTKQNLISSGATSTQINQEVKNLNNNLTKEWSVEVDQIRNIQAGIDANVLATKTLLTNVGAPKSEITKAVNEIKTDGAQVLASYKQEAMTNPNSVQYFDPKTQSVSTVVNKDGSVVSPTDVKQDTLPRVSLNIQSDTIRPDVVTGANKLVSSAVSTANKFSIPQLDLSKNLDKGISLANIVREELKKDPTTGAYKTDTQTGQLLNLSQTYVDPTKTFTTDQIVSTSGKPVKLTEIKDTVTDPNTGKTTNFAYAKVGEKYVTFKKNDDGTYTGIGSTYAHVDKDESFLDSLGALGDVIKYGSFFVAPELGAAVNAIDTYQKTGDIGASLLSAGTAYFAPKLGEVVSNQISAAIVDKLSGQVASGAISKEFAQTAANSIAGATTSVALGKLLNPDADFTTLLASGAASGAAQGTSSDIANAVFGGGDKEKGAQIIQDLSTKFDLKPEQIINPTVSAVKDAVIGLATGKTENLGQTIATDVAASLGGSVVGNAVKDAILNVAPGLDYIANAAKVTTDIGTQAFVRGQDVGQTLSNSAGMISAIADKMTPTNVSIEERSRASEEDILKKLWGETAGQIGPMLAEVDLKKLPAVEVWGSGNIENVLPQQLTTDQLKELIDTGKANLGEIEEYRKRTTTGSTGISFAEKLDPNAPAFGGTAIFDVGGGSSVGTKSDSWFELIGFTSGGNPLYQENNVQGKGPLFTLITVDGSPKLVSQTGQEKVVSADIKKDLETNAEVEKKKYNASDVNKVKIPEQENWGDIKTWVESSTPSVQPASTSGGGDSGGGVSGGSTAAASTAPSVTPSAAPSGAPADATELSTYAASASSGVSYTPIDYAISQYSKDPGVSNYYTNLAQNILASAGISGASGKNVTGLAYDLLKGDLTSMLGQSTTGTDITGTSTSGGGTDLTGTSGSGGAGLDGTGPGAGPGTGLDGTGPGAGGGAGGDTGPGAGPGVGPGGGIITPVTPITPTTPTTTPSDTTVTTSSPRQQMLDYYNTITQQTTPSKPSTEWFDKFLATSMVPTAYQAIYDPMAQVSAIGEFGADSEPVMPQPMSPLSQFSSSTDPQAYAMQGALSMPSSYYQYGVLPEQPAYAQLTPNVGTPYARGGLAAFTNGGLTNTAALFSAHGGKVPHKGSHYVQGAGGGQDDLIDARLADGEYVFDADVVAALGDGSNAEGAKRLDKMREAIRKHKRSAPNDKIPPKAKSPLAYFKGAK